MPRVHHLVWLAALAVASAGCAPGTGPNFMRLYDDTGHQVVVREISQSNSPNCQPVPGTSAPNGQRITRTPESECVLSHGTLAPGELVTFGLGNPQPNALLPEIMVTGDGLRRCMLLPFGLGRVVGGTFAVSTLQPGGCEIGG